MVILENDIIALRGLAIEYVNDMFEYASDERVGKFAGYTPHTRIEETIDMMTMLREKNEVWGIYYKESDTLIGTIGIHYGGTHPLHQEKVHAIGFELSPVYWGKGIMKMACDLALDYFFHAMKGQVIYANHFDYNDRSAKFIQKYGMEFEGNWYSKKRGCNNAVYRLTREMFISNQTKDIS